MYKTTQKNNSAHTQKTHCTRVPDEKAKARHSIPFRRACNVASGRARARARASVRRAQSGANRVVCVERASARARELVCVCVLRWGPHMCAIMNRAHPGRSDEAELVGCAVAQTRRVSKIIGTKTTEARRSCVRGPRVWMLSSLSFCCRDVCDFQLSDQLLGFGFDFFLCFYAS